MVYVYDVIWCFMCGVPYWFMCMMSPGGLCDLVVYLCDVLWRFLCIMCFMCIICLGGLCV